jgi:hypothetical protein
MRDPEAKGSWVRGQPGLCTERLSKKKRHIEIKSIYYCHMTNNVVLRYCHKYLRETVRKKDFFWLIVADVPVHWSAGSVVSGLLGGRVSWQRAWWSRAAHFMVPRSTEGPGKEPGTGDSPRTCLQWPPSSSQVPSRSFCHLPMMPSNYECTKDWSVG